jgi:hypothetical protein
MSDPNLNISPEDCLRENSEAIEEGLKGLVIAERSEESKSLPSGKYQYGLFGCSGCGKAEIEIFYQVKDGEIVDVTFDENFRGCVLRERG